MGFAASFLTVMRIQGWSIRALAILSAYFTLAYPAVVCLAPASITKVRPPLPRLHAAVLFGARRDALFGAGESLKDVSGELGCDALESAGSSLIAAATECETEWEECTVNIFEASQHLGEASKEGTSKA